MATVISTMSVELSLDATGFNRQMEAVGTKLKETGDRIRGIGTTLTATVTTPIVAGFGAAVWAASDLNETMNKTNVVFGDAANSVMAWSQDSATAFGLSQNEALGFASTFGNIFTGMGMTGEAAADLSTNFVQLGADLGSFNNVPTAEALDAIRAGVMGEYEPLRRFGIVLTEAEVNAKALEMGLVDANGEVTEAGKVAARTALIQEKSANAQGDFANTSGSLANQMKILRARLTNMAASIGQVLLPYVTRVVGWLAQWADKFTELSDRSRKIVVIVGLIVAAIGPLLIAIGTVAGVAGSVAKNFGMIVKVMKAVRVATMASLGPFLIIIAILAALYFVWTKDLFGIRTKIEKWFAIFKAPGGGLDRLKAKFEAIKKVVLEFASKWLPKLANAFVAVFSTIGGWVLRFIKWFWKLGIIQKIFELAVRAAKWFAGMLAKVWDAVKGPLGKVLDWIKRGVGSLVELFQRVVNGIKARLDPLRAAFEDLKRTFASVVAAVTALFAGDFSAALDHAKAALSGLLDFFGHFGQFMISILSGAFNAIWDVISGIDWAGIGSAILGYLGTAVAAVGNLYDKLRPKAEELINGFVDWITTYNWVGLGATILGYIDDAVDAVGSLLEKLVPIATDLINGFVNFITTYNWAGLGTSILGYIDDAVDAIGSLLEKLVPLATDLVNSFVNFITTYDWAGLGTSILGYIDDAVDAIGSLLEKLLPLATDLINGFVNFITTYDWAGLGTSLLGYIDDAVDAIGSVLEKLVPLATDLINGFVNFISTYDWAGLGTSLLGYIDDAVDAIGSVLEKLVPLATDLINGFVNFISTYDWAGLGTSILGYIDDAVDAIGSLLEKLKPKAKDLIDGFLAKASESWATVETWLKSLPTLIVTAVGDLASTLWNTGYNLIWGIKQGMQNYWDNTLWPWVSGLAGQITGALTAPFKIFSPSRVMRDIGDDIMAGLYVGLTKAAPAVLGAVEGVATGIAATPFGAPSLAGVGGGNTTNTITINVTGSGDPTATADAVFSRLNRELGLRGPI